MTSAEGTESGLSAEGGTATAGALTLGAAVRQPRRPTIWTTIRRQRLALTGALIVTFFAVVAVVGPMFAPHGPTYNN